MKLPSPLDMSNASKSTLISYSYFSAQAESAATTAGWIRFADVEHRQFLRDSARRSGVCARQLYESLRRGLDEDSRVSA